MNELIVFMIGFILTYGALTVIAESWKHWKRCQRRNK